MNFYHPDILPRSLINNETTQTCSVAQQDDGDVEDDFFYDNWTKCFSPSKSTFKMHVLIYFHMEMFMFLSY